MSRIPKTCILLLALTLLPTTGIAVAGATGTDMPALIDGPGAPPTASAGQPPGDGTIICDALGDPEDIIDGNRGNGCVDDIGGSGTEGYPGGVPIWLPYWLLNVWLLVRLP
jgi:hypothetical protein